MNEALLKQIKTKLQEYWVNELHLPLEIQLKSMAIMDITLENWLKTKSTRKLLASEERLQEFNKIIENLDCFFINNYGIHVDHLIDPIRKFFQKIETIQPD